MLYRGQIHDQLSGDGRVATAAMIAADLLRGALPLSVALPLQEVILGTLNAAPGQRDKTGANREGERFHGPLLLPGRCPPYVRNYRYAPAYGGTR